MYKCQYCNKEYKNKYLLNRHVKSSVLCIKSREGEPEESSTHDCPCGYSTPRIDNLIRHQAVCSLVILTRTLAERDVTLKDYVKTIEDREKTIEDRDRTIEDHVKTIATDSKTIAKIEEQVKLLMTRPINVNTHNHNNTTNNNNSGPTYNMSYYKQHIQENFESITQPLLQGVMNQITLDDISYGGSGLAKFVKKHLDHQHLLMLDQARRKGAYKDANGQVVVDAKLRSLLQMIGEAGYPPAKKIFIDWNTENPDSFLDTGKSKTLTSLLGSTGWLNRVGEGKTDEDDSEILSSFVDELASGYTKEALHNHLDQQAEPPLIDIDEVEDEVEVEVEVEVEDEDEVEVEVEVEDEVEVEVEAEVEVEVETVSGDESDVSSEWPETDEDPESDEEYETEVETESITSSQFDVIIGTKNYETCLARGTREEDNLYQKFKPQSKYAIAN
jgi:hypothetical protein